VSPHRPRIVKFLGFYFYSDVSRISFQQGQVYAVGLNPLLVHLREHALDKVFDLVVAGVGGLLSGPAYQAFKKRLNISHNVHYGKPNRELMGASLKKLTRGADFQKLPIMNSSFEDVLQGSFVKMTFTHPAHDHGCDVAFYTSSGPGIAQCKYYL
jgi:hypothetical protein